MEAGDQVKSINLPTHSDSSPCQKGVPGLKKILQVSSSYTVSSSTLYKSNQSRDKPSQLGFSCTFAHG